MIEQILRSRVLLVGLLMLPPVLLGASAPTMTFVRLTPAEYRRIVQDVFGPTVHIDESVINPGVREQGLLALGARKLTLSSAELEHYEAVARQVAAQVMEPRRRATLVHCLPKSNDAPDPACSEKFIVETGRYLYRRPLLANETRALVATAAAATEKLGTFEAGLRAALVQMLVSPDFLFRIERSEPDPARPGTLRLDAYSQASRLSFYVWDTAPDSELLAAAQTGKLTSPDGLRQQVDRLLASPRLEDGLRAFFSDMLGFDAFATLSIDSNLYPKFTKNVEDDAPEQTLRTIADHLLNRDGDYRDLFVTRKTFLTPALAAIYNVPLVRSQELGGAIPWVPYEFPDADPHVGILTHESFLALYSHPGTSSPTLRGKAVRENILCQRISPPPPNVDFSFVQDTNNPDFKTVRQRLTKHRENTACASCHRLMDPIGLTFEAFDASGSLRAAENGVAIDTSGELNGKKFNTIAEFAAVIREEPATTACVVNRVYEYGTQRLATDAEKPWLIELRGDLLKNGVKWRELLRRVTLNADFYTVPAEEPPTTAARP